MERLGRRMNEGEEEIGERIARGLRQDHVREARGDRECHQVSLSRSNKGDNDGG